MLEIISNHGKKKWVQVNFDMEINGKEFLKLKEHISQFLKEMKWHIFMEKKGNCEKGMDMTTIKDISKFIKSDMDWVMNVIIAPNNQGILTYDEFEKVKENILKLTYKFGKIMHRVTSEKMQIKEKNVVLIKLKRYIIVHKFDYLIIAYNLKEREWFERKTDDARKVNKMFGISCEKIHEIIEGKNAITN